MVRLAKCDTCGVEGPRGDSPGEGKIVPNGGESFGGRLPAHGASCDSCAEKAMAAAAKKPAKRASYRLAVAWIAENDSAGESDALEAGPVSELVTTALVADLFGKTTEEVARAIVAYRKRIHDSFAGKD